MLVSWSITETNYVLPEAHLQIGSYILDFNYTAISINVVGLKLQAYESRPNGGMGIYWNFHISVQEICKFVFLPMEYLFLFP